MTKAIVTGSKGFIGGNLLEELINRDFNTIGIDLHDFYNQKEWKSNLVSILDGFCPDVIFHVGACSNTLELDVNYMMSVNFESTKVISDWCLSNNSKLIYSSSAANYGTDNEYPSNLYGWSKYTSECYVVANKGLALRYFNVYGKGEGNKGRMASFVYQAYLKKISGESIMIFPGLPQRDFVYIKDVISSNIFAYDNYDILIKDWYDVGSGESRKFEDILDCLNIESYGYTDKSEIPKGYQFFTSSSKFMPNWYPKYNLDSGIKDYIKSLENE